MANPFLLLSGAGMILVGIVFPLYFQRRLKTPWRLFVYGAAVWLVAMLIKGIMDIVLTNNLKPLLDEQWGIPVMLTVMGLYLGIRTGIMESGLSYFVACNSDLRPGYREALSFGIGFGAAEALLLGVSTTINICVLIMFPQIISPLPQGMQETIISQLSMSTLAAIPPVAERIFAITLHVFATLLVFLSLARHDIKYLLASVAFKAAADGMIPWLAYLLDFSKLLDLFLAEVPVGILALASLAGIIKLKKKFRKNSN